MAIRYPALFRNEERSYTYSQRESSICINLKNVHHHNAKSDSIFRWRVIPKINSYEEATAVPISFIHEEFERLCRENLIKPQSAEDPFRLHHVGDKYLWEVPTHA